MAIRSGERWFAVLAACAPSPSAAAALPVAPIQELRPGEPLLLELRASDAVLSGHGQVRAFSWTADSSGKAFVWAASEEVDPFLRIEDAAGRLAQEDDDRGGGTTAFVAVAVEPGARFTIEVSSSRPGELGEVRLHHSGSDRRAGRDAGRDGGRRCRGTAATAREAWVAARVEVG